MKWLALGAALCGGCILPVSTGAPLPATTVGRGHFGGAMSGEAPVLDLIAENSSTSSGTAIDYGAAPAAAMTATLSYGVAEDTDVEIAAEGALYYFILPVPTGASIGLRQHFDAGDSADLAIAARIGHVGNSSTTTDSSGNKTESGASASYASLQAVVQRKYGALRPMAALNLMPATISRRFTNDPDYDFKGFASSLTLGLMFTGAYVTVGPYVTLTNFYSDRFNNSGWFPAGGILFALRPDRNAPPPIAQPMPYGAPPGAPMQ
jgi:hypothetical protein